MDGQASERGRRQADLAAIVAVLSLAFLIHSLERLLLQQAFSRLVVKKAASASTLPVAILHID